MRGRVVVISTVASLGLLSERENRHSCLREGSNTEDGKDEKIHDPRRADEKRRFETTSAVCFVLLTQSHTGYVNPSFVDVDICKYQGGMTSFYHKLRTEDPAIARMGFK